MLEYPVLVKVEAAAVIIEVARAHTEVFGVKIEVASVDE